MKSIVLFLCINVAGSLRVHTSKLIYDGNSQDQKKGANSQKSIESKAHIFFVNLQQEKDRCHCISSQLLGAPYSVTRMDAATPTTMKDRCPKIFASNEVGHSNGKGRMRPGQSALFCSNYLVWNHFYYNSTAEYAIVFEDDIIMKTKNFWDRVQGLLDSTCDASWDYLTVDGCITGGAKKHYKNLGQAAQCRHADGREERVANMATRCTHFQIIRRSAIPQILDHAHTHGPAILDEWENSFPTDSLKMSHWQPGICGQSSHNGGSANGEGCRHFDTSLSLEKTGITTQCPN